MVDKFTEELLGHVASLEELLNIPSGFFSRLLEDDDWSFIIKTHALIETAITRLLEAVVTPPLPQRFVGTLDLAGGRHSKLKLLQLLDLADPDDVKFVRGLSRIRNRLVHNVAYVGFVIAEHLAKLSPEGIREFLVETCCGFYDETDSAAAKAESRDLILGQPKIFIWKGALLFLAMTSLRIDTEKLKTQAEQAERKLLETQAERARVLTLNLSSDFSALGAYQDILAKRSLETRQNNPNAGTKA